MSLASLLLGGAASLQASIVPPGKVIQALRHVDEDLDALFRSNPAPPVALPPSTGKPLTSPSLLTPNSPARGQKRRRHQDGTPVDRLKATVVSNTSKAMKRQRSLQVAKEPVSSSPDTDEEDARLEDSYLNRRIAQADAAGNDVGNVSESSDDEDWDAEPPMHETHAGGSATNVRSKSRKLTKYSPLDETPAQRDARTIFVGNIPIDVARSKSSQKQLKRHFMSHVAGSKIESLRFRSVAFATATAALPASEGTKSAARKQVDTPPTRQQRQHERASQWRQTQHHHVESTKHRVRGDDDGTSRRDDGNGKFKTPSYLNVAEKKRVAFIRREFHQEVDSVNAYIVFAHARPGGAAEDVHIVHPFDAAGVAVERCDGTTFLDRTIRVDRVGQWRTACEAEDEKLAGDVSDPRQTLFVGNLDFAAKEEELRIWFEGVVSKELGPPADFTGGEGEAEGKADRLGRRNSWVQSVRIVRDRDTQLGKGFAYVRFADRNCVDEILGLEPDNLKFARRKLRVQRCKVVPSGDVRAQSRRNPVSIAEKPKTVHAKNISAPTPVPRGDPALGETLAGLSKDERKVAKASDADRVKRRLAKKRLKAEAGKANDKSGRKKRDRERKFGGKRDKGQAVKKGRIRGGKSMEKKEKVKK